MSVSNFQFHREKFWRWSATIHSREWDNASNAEHRRLAEVRYHRMISIAEQDIRWLQVEMAVASQMNLIKAI